MFSHLPVAAMADDTEAEVITIDDDGPSTVLDSDCDMLPEPASQQQPRRQPVPVSC